MTKFKMNKAWVNLIFLVATLAVNTVGAVGLINGYTQKQISDMYVTLLTPGPSTFSIWSVIYSFLLASVIVMIAKKDDPYYKLALDKISLLFWFSCILNIGWIITFSFVLVEISTLFILAFVFTLSLLCLQLLKIQTGKRWLLPFSFGIYTGWLFIASVVNISAALVKLKWNGLGFSIDVWAFIILAVAAALVILVMSKIKNAVFPLPVAWAYFGIYQFLSSPDGFKGAYGILQVEAILGAVVLIGAAAIQLYRNQFGILPASGAGQPPLAAAQDAPAQNPEPAEPPLQ